MNSSCSGVMVQVLPPKLVPPTSTSNRRKRTSLKRPKPATARCAAVNDASFSNQRVDTETLRAQLDRLYAEAETTRSRATNARTRLMRLSEAAENLQKRAANSVLVGKETEARGLLVEKKKLMQALEKSKNRIDVLDKLAVKINEAISMKEAQLIGNVAIYSEFSEEESGHQIRFVNPKVDSDEDPKEAIGEIDEQESEKSEENLLNDLEDASDSEDLMRNLNGASSYEEFLQYVDGKLQQVESELDMFLRVSTLILDSEQKQMNTKVQQTSGLLKDIHSIRERVASIIKAQTDRKANGGHFTNTKI
ncbi:uncharacterized protein A4U43_C01F3490 [Asparagus officinalis]|uniref:Uncharacterized protein n=1 Tax=Asparagus officinalis TaxID=4686 RepID=A0A5P1FLG3_ASPOF|nr:uncharacterized protein LOC109847501 [Asparagus officinalis]ONK79155.1 uncharacterized protein A4U43_C01F3490 [Asparagus officinalis]